MIVRKECEDKSVYSALMKIVFDNGDVDFVVVSAFDPSEPRDEQGRWTDGGGDGGDPEGSYGGLVMPPDAPAAAGGKSDKPKLSDFEKDKVVLGSFKENKERADRFVDQWSHTVKATPAEFKQNFLGGVSGTMSIQVRPNGAWQVEGRLLEGERPVGRYEREIDFDGKTAESAYFALNGGTTGKDVGKRILAGNIETYQKLGIEKVKVHANIDVGGYAWAKYGYVPTRSSWADLSEHILQRLGGGGSSGGGSGYRPTDWEEISSDEQNNIRDSWMRNTESEFLDSEIENWRENGEALHVAKQDLAEAYDGTQTWAASAVADWRRDNDQVPYSYQQILNAVNITYKDEDYDGRADPEIEFDDSKLREPTDAPPKDQLELPGFKPVDLSGHLTQKMRDEISDVLVKAFNDRAEENQSDVDPPDYLSENIGDSQNDVWENMSERERYRYADQHGLIEDIPDDDNQETPVAVESGTQQTLRELAQSSDPKALWAIADSPQGKDLLLNSDWNGVLNLKDKETMDRFNAYVGRGKGKSSAAAS